MGEGDVTVVGGHATTVVTQDVLVGANDVSIAGVGDGTINCATDVAGVGTIW